MPAEDLKNALEGAEAAVSFAQQVRRYHRRRTHRTAQQRTTDVELAITRLREAMAPLRSEIGRFPYGAQTDAAEREREKVRNASEAIQRERRKLWKMRTKRPQEAITV